MIKTQLFLEGYNVDLDSDVVIPLNYAIADVREPEKKSGNFTKTISLPGTTNNNEIFSFLYDTSVLVNSSGTYQYDLGFDPNLKSECVITYEGAEIFRGYLELNKIVKIDNYKVRYEVTCTGNLVNLFFSIGEKFLSDISLDEYNHAYTYDVQKASWNNYIYKNGVTQSYALGDGYVYPYIDYATNNDTDWKVTDFKPAVYVYTILKKIFETEGFSWTSTFLESSHFKSLIIPYTQGQALLSNSQILDRTFRASSTSDLIINASGSPVYTTIPFQDDSSSPNFDPGNVYNTSTYTFTASNSGTYNIIGGFNIDLQFNTSGTTTLNQSSIYPIANIITYRNGVVINALPVNIRASNATSIQANAINIDSGYTAGSAIPSGTYSTIGNGQSICQTYINQGDIVNIKIYTYHTGFVNATGQTPSVGNYWRTRVKSGSYFTTSIADTTIMEGDTVDMNGVLPQQIKQKDFVSSIIKMFNLYVDQDKLNSNNFIIEPRDDFYASTGTVRDWTYKLDMSRDLEIIPMGELDAKTYHFTYKDDADYYNKKYKTDYGYNYGHKLYSVRNDHRKNERKTEVIFSATPLADRNATDRVVPRIFDISSTGIPTPKTGNIRILYYGGVKTTQFPYNYMTSSGTTYTQSSYAYAGHLDSVSAPTFDLSFGMPIEVYYTATAYTDGNLFNRYWRKMINEITDKDSKIIRGYFHLNAIDILRLDFRDVYYFERDYYRLNKIIDYNPAEVKPTLCEFIKIKDAPSFTFSTGTITGGTTDTGIGLDGAVVYNPRSNENTNYARMFQLQSGTDNIINPSAMGVIVTGNDNYVGYNDNVSIIGSSGVSVLPGVTNVNVIGSNDLVLDSTYNDLTIVNNIIQGNIRVVGKQVDYRIKPEDRGSMIGYLPTGNRTTYLPDVDDIQDGWTCIVKNGNNSGYTVTVTITSGTTTPIWSPGDGTTASTHVLAAGDAYQYTYFNGYWIIY